MSDPRALFLVLLAETLWIEQALADEELGRLRREASTTWVEQAVAEHEQRARLGVERVETLFRTLGVEPAATTSDAFRELRRDPLRR